MDVETLAWVHDALALEGVVGTILSMLLRLADGGCAILVIEADTNGTGACKDACGQLEISLVLANVGVATHAHE